MSSSGGGSSSGITTIDKQEFILVPGFNKQKLSLSNIQMESMNQFRSLVAKSEQEFNDNNNNLTSSRYSSKASNGYGIKQQQQQMNDYVDDDKKKQKRPKMNWLTYDTGETESELQIVEDKGLLEVPYSSFETKNTYSYQSPGIRYQHNYPLQAHINNNYRICVLFLHQNDRTRQFLWNRLAACFTSSDIIHVELYFEHDRTTCAVSGNVPVSFIRGKIYSNRECPDKRWECVTLSLDAHAYDAVYQFCRREQGVPFDQWNLYCFLFAPCTMFHKGWICSRLVTSAFKYANIFPPSVDENSMTPKSVLDYLLQWPIEKIQKHSLVHYDVVP